MARSKITKKVKLSRHRRRHRRKSTRSGGRLSLSRSSSSHRTPHHNQEREFLEKLRVSDLKYYSLKSFADLARRAYSYSTNVPEKISNIVEKSSCGKAYTISDLINIASESGQISGTKEITESVIDEIFKDCMIGLDKIDAAVVLRLCINDFFGPCQKQSGGKKPPPRLPPSVRSANYENMCANQRQYNGYLNATRDPNAPDCCEGLLVLFGAFIIMMFLSGAGRFTGIGP